METGRRAGKCEISTIDTTYLLAGALAASLVLPAAAFAQGDAKTLRIGYQKYGNFVVLKARGTLEKRLASQR